MVMAKSLDVKMIFVAVIVVVSFFDGVVGGRTNILEDIEIDEHLKLLNKPAVKTIKVFLVLQVNKLLFYFLLFLKRNCRIPGCRNV